MSNVTAIKIDHDTGTASELLMLRAKRIRRNPEIDPRISRNTSDYLSIKESVRVHGVNQPILVRPVEGDPDHDYEVVAGNTRHQSTLDNDIELIPCMVKTLTDAQARIHAALENIQRANLTPIEEAKHAQVVLIDMNNDHEEVCKQLGWSRTKLNSRILLSHCNLDVAEALVQKQIVIGHAELLASVPAENQTAILAKIIERNMTVTEARQRLFSLSLDLNKAKFDTTACHGCPKNSATSRDMFDNNIGGSQCLDVKCWEGKATALIDVKLIEAKADYGVVHTDLTIAANSYVELGANGPSGVGETQFSACTGCVSYGAVVSTQYGNEGTLKGNLCFDKPCNAKMRESYQKVLAALAVEPARDGDGTDSVSIQPITDNTSNKKTGIENPKAAQPKVPGMRKAMRRHAFDLYASMGQQAVRTNMNLALAIAVTSLYFDVRNEIPSELLKAVESGLGVSSRLQTDKRVEMEIQLAAKSVEELTSLMQRLAAVTVFRRDGADLFEKSVSGSQSIGFIQFTGLEPVNFFKMSAEFLKTLTKAGAVEELKRSGFEAKYTKDRGDKAFKQLCVMPVDALIKEVMGFELFSWEGYLPASMEVAHQSTGTPSAA